MSIIVDGLRALMCAVGIHKYTFVRTIPGVKIVEHCKFCSKERVRYVRANIDMGRKSW